jgi:hypothetical protein
VLLGNAQDVGIIAALVTPEGFVIRGRRRVEVAVILAGGAAMARGGWVYVGGRAGNKPSAGEKSVIVAA